MTRQETVKRIIDEETGQTWLTCDACGDEWPEGTPLDPCPNCPVELEPEDIPADYPVQPTMSGNATCGNCGLSWDDDKVTGMTPTPSGRCPFETFHN